MEERLGAVESRVLGAEPPPLPGGISPGSASGPGAAGHPRMALEQSLPACSSRVRRFHVAKASPGARWQEASSKSAFGR